MNHSQRLRSEVERFRKIKDDLLDLGLNDLEATVLGARLLGESLVTYDEDFMRIKDKPNYKAYMPGVLIHISEIKTRNSLLSVTLHRQDYADVNLKGQSAALFLALVSLKFKDSETDATSGFSVGSDLNHELEMIGKNSNSEIYTWDYRMVENLRTKLRPVALQRSLNNLSNDLYRFSVSPLRITFSEEARSIFNRFTEHAFESFCKRYHYDSSAFTGHLR